MVRRTLIPLVIVCACLLPPAWAVVAVATPDPVGENYVNGQRYYTGDGVPLSYERAAQFFRLAAEAGHPYAQYSLALMFEQGYGFSKDLNQAAEWYQKAVAQGHQGAAFRLGLVREALGQGPRTGISTVGDPSALPPMPDVIRITGAAEPDPAPRPVVASEPVAKRRPPIKAPPKAVAKPTAKPLAKPAVIPPTPVEPVEPVEVVVAKPPVKAAQSARAPAVLEEPDPRFYEPEQQAYVRPAPPPRPIARPPPARPPPASRPPVPSLPAIIPAVAMEPDAARAIREYQAAMALSDYPTALDALQEARYAGEIPALGLNEIQSAETLAQLAILARDDNRALIYLRQASALGSVTAQSQLDRLAAGADLGALPGGVIATPAGEDDSAGRR